MKWIRHLTVLVCCFGASQALAEINLNGFLSVGAGYLTDDDEITSYSGYDGDWSTDPDTVFALQASAVISDKVTATGQLIARGADDYDLEAEWAYLTYAASDNWDIRLGRLRAPFFAYSDFLDVGYAYPFIAPPVQTYRFPFTTVEGVDTLVRGRVGNWDSSFQAYFGRLTDETPLGDETVDLDLVGFAGVNWSMTRDWLTLRATYNRAEFSIEPSSELSNALGTGFLDVLNGAGFGSVADAINASEEDATFYGVSVNIDYNDWLFISEYTVLDVDNQNIVSDDDAIYVLLGKRMGDFTYHITWDYAEDDPDLDFVSAIPAGVAPQLDALRAAAIGLVPPLEANDVTVGVRWDFAPATALKFEITDLNRDNGTVETDGMLVRLAVDMVF